MLIYDIVCFCSEKTLFPVAGFELVGDDEITPPIHLPSRVAFGTYYYENVYVSIFCL